LLGLTTFALAFGILAVSLLKSSSVTYVLASQDGGTKSLPNPFWMIKAVSDRIWFLTTSDPLKRAEEALIFADQRLGMSVALVENQNVDGAMSTLHKAETYLDVASENEQEARKGGQDTCAFLKKLAASSLNHRQVIEDKILPVVPEEGKPMVVKTEDYSKHTYKSSKDLLTSQGEESPKSPFDSH